MEEPKKSGEPSRVMDRQNNGCFFPSEKVGMK